MENERSENQRVLEAQGRLNLELGAVMAQEKFMAEMDAIGQDDSLPTMPPEQVQELFDAVHAARDRVKAKKRRAAMRKNLVRYGAAAAAALVIIPFAVMNVGAGRTAVANYMIQNFDKYSVIRYDQEYNAMAPFGWRSEYYPRWLPEGYEIESVTYEEHGDNIHYVSSDGLELSFYVLSSYNGYRLNNEEYEATPVTIGDQEAILYMGDDKRRLILYLPVQNGSIQIEGIVSEANLCRIAESVKIS